MLKNLLLLAAPVLMLSSSCASVNQDAYDSALDKYRSASGHKAMAVCLSSGKGEVTLGTECSTTTEARDGVLRGCSNGVGKNPSCSNCQLVFVDDQQIFDALGYFKELARTSNNNLGAAAVALAASEEVPTLPAPDPKDYLIKGFNPSPSQMPSGSSGGESGIPASDSPSVPGTLQSSSCPTTLAYLAPKLPQYSDPDLTRMRTTIIETNVSDVMQQSIKQGYTPSSAADAALRQAQSDQQSLKSAESCLGGAAADPDKAARALQDGTFDFSNTSVSASCAKAYVLGYYGWVTNREVAVALACMAHSGSQ